MPRWLPPTRLLGVVAAVVLLVGLASTLTRGPRAAVLTRSRALPAPSSVPVPVAPAPATTEPATTAPAATAAAGPVTASRLSNFWGADISWPQCNAPRSIGLPLGFLIIGLNDGRPFTTNPCLGEQLSAAYGRSGYAVYANIDAPASGDPSSYGAAIAADILRRLHSARLTPRVVWLDVEVINHWSSPAVNVAVIRAAVAGLAAGGITAGIYSSPPMWQQITGGATLSLPVWTATAVLDYRDLTPYCERGLGGHPAVLGQYVAAYGGRLLDIDVLCAAGLPKSVALFSPGRASG